MMTRFSVHSFTEHTRPLLCAVALAGLAVAARAQQEGVCEPVPSEDCGAGEVQVVCPEGTISSYTVPEGVEALRITAGGAWGGNTVNGSGGVGGVLTGAVAVSPGDMLRVLVGQAGLSGGGLGGGGGGGSFIGMGSTDQAFAQESLLVVAGGGGGAGTAAHGGGGGTPNGGQGQGPTGGAGGTGGDGGDPGDGCSGAGGGAPTGQDGNPGDGTSGCGAGGGGAGGKGGDSPGQFKTSFGGQAAVDGGAGGDPHGGFGGGGGIGQESGGGGGGGGYAGGGGGGLNGGGGGGSSFFADEVIDQSMEATNEGHGFVFFCEISLTEVFAPEALEADPQPLMELSDGNGLFEPGERVVVAPAWRNGGAFSQDLIGTASELTGPSGPTYALVDGNADYGLVEPLATASCRGLEDCYEVEITPAGAPRPATHWDAAFDEALSDETTRTWTLHVGDSFADMPRTSPFYPAIETLLHGGVSSVPALARRELRVLGCGEGVFCPTAPNTRAQAAVFLLMAASPGFTPDPCVDGEERFADVPFDSPFCPWIEELARREATSGCGDGGDYCPDAPVSRGQMAVLLLRASLGTKYTPPECTGELADVPCDSPFADWIEDLLTRDITAGCATDPLRYCPAEPVARQQMAVFVTQAFGLTLYGP